MPTGAGTGHLKVLLFFATGRGAARAEPVAAVRIEVPDHPVRSALVALFIGILLITMVLAGTLLARLPTCSAMIYLAAGFALGPAGLAVITPDPTRYAPALIEVRRGASALFGH